MSNKSLYHQQQSVKNPGKYWNLFYKSNGDRFFKDRRWVQREFGQFIYTDERSRIYTDERSEGHGIQILKEEENDNDISPLTAPIYEWKRDEMTVLMEVGCGVGNFMFPLIEDYYSLDSSTGSCSGSGSVGSGDGEGFKSDDVSIENQDNIENLANLSIDDTAQPAQKNSNNDINGHSNKKRRKKLYVIGCDFSQRAVEICLKHPLYSDKWSFCFCCDISKGAEDNEIRDDINGDMGGNPLVRGMLESPIAHLFTNPSNPSNPSNLPNPSNPSDSSGFKGADIISLIFVLSALHPSKMPLALHNIFEALRPGGRVLFRDYARGDFAQVRFEMQSPPLTAERADIDGDKNSIDGSASGGGKRIGGEVGLYLRQDGTMSYFFTQGTFTYFIYLTLILIIIF